MSKKFSLSSSSSSSSSSIYLMTTFFIITRLISTVGNTKPCNIINNILPSTHLDISDKLRTDAAAINQASHDYGNIVKQNPDAVFFPTSISDITTLIKSSFDRNPSFHVAAKGCGHSIRGQAMATLDGGVVVEMGSLRQNRNGGVVVLGDRDFADVGGEVTWTEVLRSTMEYGVVPVSWTDFLDLSVGGTLSNGGISGQTFRFGPQISNVRELDVITGKGEFVTCSRSKNSELFYGVLGGLGQFGIITRARISLEPAPNRVKWFRMLYTNFSDFTRDQEHLISFNGRFQRDALDYLEGSLILNQGSPNNWRSSFFPESDLEKISLLVTEHDVLYCLEVAKNYDDSTTSSIDEELSKLLKGLSYVPGFKFEKDVSHFDFLDRVRSGMLKLQSQGLWEVPHPWLNLFIPKSRINDFNSGVFKGILFKRNITTGPVLVYPMNRNKWDDKMSAVIPDEETFYAVGFLHSSGFDDWQSYDDQNKEILNFCDKSGFNVKQYLPHYITKEDWMNHFGSKWEIFQERKERFNPKMILSPGQRIFNSIQSIPNGGGGVGEPTATSLKNTQSSSYMSKLVADVTPYGELVDGRIYRLVNRWINGTILQMPRHAFWLKKIRTTF